jgi:hypothetical protein
VIGTVEFLAPELLDKGFWKEPSAGAERDVFALGVLAFELLRGRHPTGLGGDATMGDFLVAYRELAKDEAAFPAGVEGDALERFYRRCLALRVSKRAKNGAEVAILLDAAKAPSGIAAPAPARAEGTTLESARTEQIAPLSRGPASMERSPPSEFARSRTRAYAPLVGAAMVIFAMSFYVAYRQPATAGPGAAPTSALGATPPNHHPEEPPDPPVAPPPLRATASAASPPPAASARAAPACPPDMAAIGGPRPFCIDRREVTVQAYRSCDGCGQAKEAYWPGPTFTDAAKLEQSNNCTNTRPGLDNYPINCVSHQDAAAYCTRAGKRLPRMEEWRAARSSITFCTEVGGVCPLFEWSADPASLAGYRATRGPSFRHASTLEGSNIEVARNDDLGFRCARDPLP